MTGGIATRLFGCVAALLLAGCLTVDVSKFPDPHGHKYPPHKFTTEPQHARDFERHDPHDLILRKPTDTEQVENPGHTKEAVIVVTRHQRFGYEVPVLLIYRNDKPTIAFMSKSWPNRPIGDLAWLNDQLLTFDLYGGKDLGWHYIVDASTARVIFAAPFNDE